MTRPTWDELRRQRDMFEPDARIERTKTMGLKLNQIDREKYAPAELKHFQDMDVAIQVREIAASAKGTKYARIVVANPQEPRLGFHEMQAIGNGVMPILMAVFDEHGSDVWFSAVIRVTYSGDGKYANISFDYSDEDADAMVALTSKLVDEQLTGKIPF